jgi:hypothetical protein
MLSSTWSRRFTALDIGSKKYERLPTRGRHLDRVQARIGAKLEARKVLSDVARVKARRPQCIVNQLRA